MDSNKNSNSALFIQGFLGRYRLNHTTFYNSLVRQQNSSLNPSWVPHVSGHHSQRLFHPEKTIESFDCKVNGWALGAVLRHSLGLLEGQAPTQGVSKSVALATGSNLLDWGKSASTLAILTWFKSHFMHCKFWAVTTEIFFPCEMKFWWSLRELVTNHSSTHSLAQYLDHSLISE